MRATPRDAPRPRHPRSPQKLADGAGSRGALATFPASFGTPGAGRCPSPVARGAGHRSGRAARGYHPAGVALVKAGHTRRGDHAARLFLTPAPPAPSAPRSRGFGPGAARAGRGRLSQGRSPLPPVARTPPTAAARARRFAARSPWRLGRTPRWRAAAPSAPGGGASRLAGTLPISHPEKNTLLHRWRSRAALRAARPNSKGGGPSPALPPASLPPTPSLPDRREGGARPGLSPGASPLELHCVPSVACWSRF